MSKGQGVLNSHVRTGIRGAWSKNWSRPSSCLFYVLGGFLDKQKVLFENRIYLNQVGEWPMVPNDVPTSPVSAFACSPIVLSSLSGTSDDPAPSKRGCVNEGPPPSGCSGFSQQFS